MVMELLRNRGAGAQTSHLCLRLYKLRRVSLLRADSCHVCGQPILLPCSPGKIGRGGPPPGPVLATFLWKTRTPGSSLDWIWMNFRRLIQCAGTANNFRECAEFEAQRLRSRPGWRLRAAQRICFRPLWRTFFCQRNDNFAQI